MNKFLQSVAFNLGFIVGVLLFIGINFYSLSINYRGCIDCFGESGFPFLWMDQGWFLQRILWLGLIADVLFGIISSFVMGLIFYSLWSKLLAPKLK
jgi:hypothetical protein